MWSQTPVGSAGAFGVAIGVMVAVSGVRLRRLRAASARTDAEVEKPLPEPA